MKLKNIGIAGCGFMATEIGRETLRAGYPLVMYDLNQELVDKGRARVESILSAKVKRGGMSQGEMDNCLGRLKGTTSFEDFRDCDLVIEVVIEQLEPKKKVFKELDRVCKKEAILATNTSSLLVMDMAAETSRMPQVIGTHFFPPVDKYPLVEISRTIATSDETVNVAKDFGKSLGMTCFVTKDYPGFVVNNIFIPLMIQGVRLLEKGLASAEEIDQAWRISAGQVMGPMQILDFVGLDVVLKVTTALYEQTGETVFFPPLLLKQMVAAGRCGRKTGRGFYDYTK